MTKAELRAQVDAMTAAEAAEVILIYAPDWPSKVTPIEEIRKRKGSATSTGDSGSASADDQD